MLLLLLLSCFSCVRLCAIPQTAAHQAPPTLGFSRQEHWSGLPFPSPMHESEVAQSCLTLSDPMECSLPGSSIHGIFQARVLEWGAIAFSNSYIWDYVYMCVYSVQISPMTNEKIVKTAYYQFYLFFLAYGVVSGAIQMVFALYLYCLFIFPNSFYNVSPFI